MSEPLVSIITTFYNSEAFIERAFRCIQNQTYTNLELICVNDGSTDATPQILEDYASKDPRIKTIHKENQGAAHYAKAAGQKAASGDYCFLMDHDDEISLDYIEKAVVKFQLSPELDLVSGITQYTYPHGDVKLRRRLFACNEQIDNQNINHKEDGLDLFRESLGSFRVSVLGLWKAKLFKSIPFDSLPNWIRADEVIYRKLLLNTDKIGICDGIYYYYLYNDSSAQKPSIRQVEVLETDRLSRELALEHGIYEKIESTFEPLALKNLLKAGKFYHRFKSDVNQEQKGFYKDMIKRNFVLIRKRKPYRFSNNTLLKIYYFLILQNFRLFTVIMRLKSS